MGKVLKFERKRPLNEVDTTTEPEPAVREVDRYSPEQVVEGLKKLFSARDIQQMKKELGDG